MQKRHLNFKYISDLKGRKDDNSFKELLEIRDEGLSSLGKIELNSSINIKEFLILFNSCKDLNEFCKILMETYGKVFKNIDSKVYEKTSLDLFYSFDYGKMEENKDSIYRTFERDSLKQKFILLFDRTFDEIKEIKIDSNLKHKEIIEIINSNFYKLKDDKCDALPINMTTLKVIEPLIREFFIENDWLSIKRNYRNKTLGELLDTNSFRDKYPFICHGLKMVLCDYLGLNLRNNEFHNLTENSHNPIISKIAFICILSILSLFKDIEKTSFI